MNKLLLGVSLLALVAPAVAYAQQSAEPATAAVSGQIAPGKYLVFFKFNQATLTPDAVQVVGQAAEEYKRTGAAKITATGYTDLSGSPAYNQALSERRAAAVQGELVRLGVPASVITVVGEGEHDPLIPTADGVREARNRRVEIEIPQVVAAPAPVAPAPVAVVLEAGPPPAPRWAHDFGGWYGYNLQETNGGGKSDLAGLQSRTEYLATPNLPLSLELGGFHAFNSEDDGFGARSVIGVNLQGDLGTTVHPYIGANFGGVLGKGVQDGLVAGPEVGLKFDLSDTWFLYAKAAYDYQFRNDLDEGIVNGGLGFGWRH
jgi:hypothetical protein